MSKLNSDEIKINIFKYVNYPQNLALTCRNWAAIAKDPFAKTEWLLVHYGKTHALFHAIRLGPTFIDIPLCQTLIVKKVTVSGYFIQRLLTHFGKYNQTSGIRAIQRKNVKLPWANYISIFTFVYLLDEGYKQLANSNEDLLDLSSKRNDRIISFPLSRLCPGKNLRNADLILNKRFIPFPSRPKAIQLGLNIDLYTHILEDRPSILTLATNNAGIHGTRTSRSVNRRNARLYRRRVQLNVPINNQDTLDRVVNLPEQTTNDPLIDQFFNGSSFI